MDTVQGEEHSTVNVVANVRIVVTSVNRRKYLRQNNGHEPTTKFTLTKSDAHIIRHTIEKKCAPVDAIARQELSPPRPGPRRVLVAPYPEERHVRGRRRIIS